MTALHGRGWATSLSAPASFLGGGRMRHLRTENEKCSYGQHVWKIVSKEPSGHTIVVVKRCAICKSETIFRI